MEYSSLAISFRIELGFHAANNEGAGGTNVMEPRRITVGDMEYDGISGEIIRRHILEEFVRLCQKNNVSLHPRCKGLVPDRCKVEIKQWMNEKNIDKLSPENHYASLGEEMLKNCALCDIGGYLVALQRREDKVEGTLKRDSCFEVGWLITEHPAIVDYTQHSAYDPDPEKHNLYVQNMRTGIYGGVLRIDLDRIGFNDWWWLGRSQKRYAIDENERRKRIRLLLRAIRRWLMSPSWAKQTGWLQHMGGLLEGVIVLSKDGPAPFCSPIKFELEDNDLNKPVIKRNPEYKDILTKTQEEGKDTWKVHCFNGYAQLKKEMQKIEKHFQKGESESNDEEAEGK